MNELNYNGGVYGIYFNNTLLYIGKTNRPFETRYNEHIKNINSGLNDFCKENDINQKELSYTILFDCKDCPLTNQQLECLETNYINKYKPIINIKKINKQDTILFLDKQDFPQLNEKQQKIILYYYKNLSKSAFGLLLIFLMFDKINIENYNPQELQNKLDIKKTSFYEAIKEIKNLQINNHHKENES